MDTDSKHGGQQRRTTTQFLAFILYSPSPDSCCPSALPKALAAIILTRRIVARDIGALGLFGSNDIDPTEDLELQIVTAAYPANEHSSCTTTILWMACCLRSLLVLYRTDLLDLTDRDSLAQHVAAANSLGKRCLFGNVGLSFFFPLTIRRNYIILIMAN